MGRRAVSGVLLAAALTTAVVTAGCASEGRDAPPGAQGSAPGTDAPLLAFTGQTLDGEGFDGAQLAGRPAVLWFWAPWCPTCRAQAAGVEAVAAAHAGEVAVVGVGGLADAADIREFAGQVEGPTHLVDEEGAIWGHFDVTAQSSYVLLDAEGNLVEVGFLDNEELAARVADLAG